VATVSVGSTSERFGFIEKFGLELGVRYLCDWFKVSPSGYYDYLKRGPSDRELEDRELEDRELLKNIRRIYEDSHGRYGSPRVHAKLKKEGINVGEKRVARLMRECGLVARVVKATRRMPGLKRYNQAGENLRLDLDPPTGINQVWVADVTYLRVCGRWSYLSVIMDLYSRRIIGWCLDRTRSTEVTKRTLKLALKKRDIGDGVVFHSDRGSEYRGELMQEELNNNGFKHSLNRLGYCTDNGHMESFFHSLKGELIRGNRYNTMDELRNDLFRYINQFYNSKRLHSGIGYNSPIEYEKMAA